MKFVYALGIVVSSYLLYKYKQKSQKLLLVHSNNRLSRLFHLINIKLFESFKPSLFLFSGHAQTLILEIFSLIVRLFKKLFKFYRMKYRREIFTLSDGCKIAVDHAIKRYNGKQGKIEETDKILIVLPGVTSTSRDYYVKAIVDDFCDEFDVRVVNARGFGEIKLFSPKMISSACFKDVGEYIERVCEENPNKKVFGLGFSFGGMMLARYLGTDPGKVPKNFLAGIGLCFPCCLYETKNYAEVHFNGLYSKASLANCKTTFFSNLDVIFDEKYHKENGTLHILSKKEELIKQVQNCNLMSDFDRVYTTITLGMNDLMDYYAYSKIDKQISNIKVPFLSIFSEDDPIIPIESIPFKSFQSNPNTVTVVTQYGGHLGFFGGTLIPQRIVEQPFRTFMKTVEILKDTEHKCSVC